MKKLYELNKISGTGIDCTSLGFVYQSKEFVGSGLSPENLLSIRDWIGSEEIRFVDYHIRKMGNPLL
jgi:hypothetical protein